MFWGGGIEHAQHNGKMSTPHAHATQARFLHEINGNLFEIYFVLGDGH